MAATNGASPSCDIVYRYVNPDEYKTVTNSGVQTVFTQRVRDNDELRYSLRSFMAVQGIETFHVLAHGMPPMWLNASHQRIRWWDEMVFFEQLRNERNITKQINVHNSEPAKLVVALLPGLAARLEMTPSTHALVNKGLNFVDNLEGAVQAGEDSDGSET